LNSIRERRDLSSGRAEHVLLEWESMNNASEIPPQIARTKSGSGFHQYMLMGSSGRFIPARVTLLSEASGKFRA
jgi:hypothetical protein